MFIRCDFRHPQAALLLMLICALCFSPTGFAAGKGKKGKPVTPDKPAAKTKVADARKADSKNSKNARNTPEKNSRNLKTSDKAARDGKRKEQVAARDDRTSKGRKGTRAADEKDQQRVAVKAGSRKPDSQQKLADLKTTKGNRLVTRNEVAEKKPEKNKRAVAKEEKTTRSEKTARAEHPAKPEKTLKAEKTEKAEKAGPNKSSGSVEKERQVIAAAQPARHGKFGKPPQSGLIETESADHHTPAVASTEITIQTTQAFKEGIKAAPPVPEVIEVHEYDPSKVGVDFTAGRTRPLLAFSNQNTGFNVSNKKIDVSIDPQRITEIQQALRLKGYFIGEPTGVWDDATYDAMKRYQVNQKIDATGYPTAHSLKRLGLTSW